jgi:hypothetical protein
MERVAHLPDFITINQLDQFCHESRKPVRIPHKECIVTSETSSFSIVCYDKDIDPGVLELSHNFRANLNRMFFQTSRKKKSYVHPNIYKGWI